LQRYEESEEEGYCSVEVPFLQTDIAGEVRALRIANLESQSWVALVGAVEHTFDLSSELKRNNSARNGSNSQSSFRSVRL
jgi:hypothetical protein